ncbi:MAG: hypothetical protein ACRDOL_28655 [Streptosporangiaceae bacterium]
MPVAACGPRGSAEAVAHIRKAARPGVPAILLANDGYSSSTGARNWP